MKQYGARACRVWTNTYTRGLPAEVADRRRAEIESDLADHEAFARAAAQRGVQRQVIGRVLSGIPADLSWRREARSLVRPVPGGLSVFTRFESFFSTVLVVSVAVGIGIATSLMPFLITLNGTAAEIVWMLVVMALAAALVAGLVLRDTRPVLSTVLLVLGAPAPGLAWFWLPPVYLVSIAIAVSALVTKPAAARPAH